MSERSFIIPASELKLADITQQTLGKYQYCTSHEGKMYADQDFDLGPGMGKPKPGSISLNEFARTRP
jgi:hypothetical protein